jgi:hypothetical protein
VNAKIEYKRQGDMCVATIEVQEATAEEVAEIVACLERSQTVYTKDGIPVQSKFIAELFDKKHAEAEKRIHEGVPHRTSGRIV